MYRKSKRGRTLVGKGGRITSNSKKNVAMYEQEIINNIDLTQAQKITLINDLRAMVKSAKDRGEKLTTTGFEARTLADIKGSTYISPIEKHIVAAGYSPEELADEIGVPESELLDNRNWNNSTFTYNGQSWVFEWSYTKSILKRI